MTATTADAPASASLNEKQLVAKAIRATAARVQLTHPATHADGHLRDAARMLERGYTQAATRHLDAARRTLTAGTLYRHGVFDDASHGQAALHTGQVIRHMLRVRDIQDVGEEQQRRAVQARTNQLAEDERKRQRAMQPPATTPTGGSGGVATGPKEPNPVGTFKAAPPGALQPSNSATLVGMAMELSAETARLAVTPAPRGRPGGPGLYDVKNLGHTPYLQQIVKALIEKRGLPPGRAYAIARGAIRKWSRGGGHVHPEVQAASTAAEAGEVARQGLAKAAHGHANDWAAIELAIRLATREPYHREPDETVECPHCGKYDSADAIYCDQCGHKLPDSAFGMANPNWAQQSRVPAGQSGGGQFGATGSTKTPPGKQSAKGKPPVKGHQPPVKGKPSPVTAHQTRAQQKAALLKQAASDRALARQLTAQLALLLRRSRKTTAAGRAATKAGATGKTAAPTPAKKTGTPAAGSPAGKPGHRLTRAQQIKALRTRIASLLAQAAQLTAQAAKL